MIKVLQPGLYTSVQDKGRFGYRKFGIPVSGVMDSISAGLANAILDNNENDAVLEITLIGPKLCFLEPTHIVITGAEISPKINDISIVNCKVYIVNPGDVISFGRLLKGTRCYLAVKGGLQTKTVFKSKSFYKGITENGIVSKDDLIPFKSNNNKVVEDKNGVVNNKFKFYETTILKVTKGPEFDLFSISEQKIVLQQMHSISNRINRMGFRLNEELVPHKHSIITSPVLPGTVQLIPSGHLIILMKDAQTTGGYPRIFQLTEEAIAILAQKKSNDQITFQLK